MQHYQKSNWLINLPFFLLPFLLFFSIASSAVGFYGFLFLYPLIFILYFKIKIPKYVLQIGFVLFAMYACFSITNYLNLYFPNPVMEKEFYNSNLSFSKLFKSRLSTSYLTTAIFLVFVFFISNYVGRNSLNLKSLKNLKISPLESFLKGLFYTSIVFGVIFFLEYYLKLDYHKFWQTWTVKHADPTLSYVRPTGLLGNPLTLSSMSLACFVFLYTYFCRSYFLDIKNNLIPFAQSKKQLLIYLLIPALLFLFIVFLTVSRTTTCIALLVLGIIPLFSATKKNIFKLILFIILLTISASLTAFILGYWDRLLVALQNIQSQGHADNRAYFREIYLQMIMDKPWIGNGTYWISHGLRDKYFVMMGYGDLDERNFPAHNLYLEILASGGIICGTIVTYGVLKLRKILKTYLMNKELNNYTLWIAFSFAFIANLGHAFTQNNFLESSTTYTYFFIGLIIFWDRYLNYKNMKN